MSPLLYYALPALGGYITLSIFFLRRPRLLHTPHAPAFCPRLVAHRGGELGEELAATGGRVNAMTQRADLLELDCHLTRDGVVVVSHDKNLSRQSGLNKDVSSLDFEELPLYKEELEVYFSPGHFAHGSDRHMVSLEDMFQRFPQVPMSVEIKEKDEELIYKIADLVRRFDRNEITIWASEKSSIMKKCKAANPEMPLSFTISRGFWVLLLYYLGLLPFIRIPEKFLFCFLPTIINRTYFPFSCSGLNQLAAVVLKWIIMRKSLIQHLQERGVQWCTLVIPAAKEAEAGRSRVESQPQQQQGAKQLSETLSLNKIQKIGPGMWLSDQVPLSSIPSTKKKNQQLGMVACTCNLSYLGV
uniref:Lysophospholipase D GDPD3 n=1 Tax=Marmota marmota marmota TaxID=9994 RepID=A0A8C6EZA0_MARMA